MYEQTPPADGGPEAEEAAPEDEATVEGEFREVHNEG
jgi:hypothetical protein